MTFNNNCFFLVQVFLPSLRDKIEVVDLIKAFTAFRVTVVILSASCLPSLRVSNKEFVGFKYCS